MPSFQKIAGTTLDTFFINNTKNYGITTKEDGELYLFDPVSGEHPISDFLSSSGLIVKEHEITFPSNPCYNYKFSVSDLSVIPSNKILAWQSMNAATGRSADENEMDQILFLAQAKSGSFDLIAKPLCGAVTGNYKVLYIVV
jgi:hypothetical protein